MNLRKFDAHIHYKGRFGNHISEFIEGFDKFMEVLPRLRSEGFVFALYVDPGEYMVVACERGTIVCSRGPNTPGYQEVRQSGCKNGSILMKYHGAWVRRE